MFKFFKTIMDNLNKSPVERYLAQSSDRYDLEERLKKLAYGKARLF